MNAKKSKMKENTKSKARQTNARTERGNSGRNKVNGIETKFVL